MAFSTPRKLAGCVSFPSERTSLSSAETARNTCARVVNRCAGGPVRLRGYYECVARHFVGLRGAM